MGTLRSGEQPPLPSPGNGVPHDDVSVAQRLRLIQDELAQRWQRNDRVLIECYLREFPQLRADERAVLTLIVAEVRLRLQRGEVLDLAAYRWRFPQYAAVLQRELAAARTPPPAPAADEKTAKPEPVPPPDSSPTSPPAEGTLRPPEPPVTAAGPAIPGGAHPSGYEILGELGRGGMGVVYKARQVRLDRTVALKMILSGLHAGPQELKRFYAEATAVASLQHTNVVQIYEVSEQAGQPYFSMEFVDGPSLDKKLAGAPQPLRAATVLLERLARAVHAAHEKGIVHRDLKPGNILLAGAPFVSPADPEAASPEQLYGIPKITDFGLAKRAGDDSGQTRSGELLGTPSYMAPEQAAGRIKELGPAADVWALGVILYELLTGRSPFRGATALDTISQVLHDDPVPPGRLRPRLPRDLETICLKCLQKDPRRRYGSALELADDCAAFLRGEAIKARPPGRAEQLWRWCRRNPLAASLLLAVTLGSALGLWHLSQLSESLVQSAALESAAQQTETLDEMNRYYSRVVNHIDPDGTRARPDWAKVPGAFPNPATLTIEVGGQISKDSVSGVRVRMYSEYPFRFRKGGAEDDFEREALARLQQKPDKPYYAFTEMNGRPVLRYATARLMVASCVNCHNNHPYSPKTDWKVGDLRGVLEIIRPLDTDANRIAGGLRGTFFVVVGVGCGLLVVCGLVLLVGRRRRARMGADQSLG